MTRVDDHDGCDNEEEKENHGSNHFSNSVMFEGMGTPCWPISMNQKTGIYKQILYIYCANWATNKNQRRNFNG